MTLFFEKFFFAKLDFSKTKMERLYEATNRLQEICIKMNYSVYVDRLNKVIDAGNKKNTKEFKKLVISVDFFGGAGALWEFESPDKNLQSQFETSFCNWVDCLIEIGINNGRVLQVRRGM